MWPHRDRALPRNTKHPGVQGICTLKVNNEVLEKKLKNEHWYSRRPKYFRAKFDLKVRIEPDGLEFQLFSKSGKHIQSSNLIEVEWEPLEASVEATGSLHTSVQETR